MSLSGPALSAPACATDTGSWCAKLWNSTGISWLAENADDITGHAIRIVLILVLALVLRSVLHRAINRLTGFARGSVPVALRPLADRAEGALAGPGASSERRSQRARSLGSLLKSITSFTVFCVSFILVLSELGLNIAPLLASAGIAGVALGFGAQNLVKDFLAGIFMILEDQYGVGDSVDLGPASGTVLEVGLRTTTVQGGDGTLWHVRNGEVLRVGNSSQAAAVVTIDVPLAYGVDAAKAGTTALAAATQIAAEQDFVDSIVEQPSLLGVTAMGPEGVTVQLVTTVKAGTQYAFGRAVRAAVIGALAGAGIAAGIPTTAARPQAGH
jgi:small-conductance mechanosensitive channel